MQAEEGLFYVPQSRNTLLDKITQAYFKRAPRDPRGPRFLDNSTDNSQSIGGSQKHLGQHEYKQELSASNRTHGLRSTHPLTSRQRVGCRTAVVPKRAQNTPETESGCQHQSGQIGRTRTRGVFIPAEDQLPERDQTGLPEGAARDLPALV